MFKLSVARKCFILSTTKLWTIVCIYPYGIPNRAKCCFVLWTTASAVVCIISSTCQYPSIDNCYHHGHTDLEPQHSKVTLAALASTAVLSVVPVHSGHTGYSYSRLPWFVASSLVKAKHLGPSKTRLFSLVTCMNVLHDFFVKDDRYNYSITFVQHAVVNANLLSVFRNSLLNLLLCLRPTY